MSKAPPPKIKTWAELGKRVAEARKAANLSQERLGDDLGLDRSAVCRIESGHRALDSLELSRLARLLDRPIEWFVALPPQAVISRRAERADAPELPADRLLEDLARGVELLVEFGALRSHVARRERTTVRSVAAAEDAARSARRGLGQGHGPIRDLAAAAEKLGLFAFTLEYGASLIDGSYVSLDAAGVALINGATESGRRRFTLAHEIAHHLLQDEFATDVDVATGRDRREQLINAVAIHFLMPRSSVAARWRELVRAHGDRRSAAIIVSAEYGLSWSAACSQLCNLGLIDGTERETLVAQPPRRADYLELGLTLFDDLVPPSLPPGYSAAVIKAYRKHKISAERAVELLRGSISLDDLPPADEIPLDAMRREIEPL